MEHLQTNPQLRVHEEPWMAKIEGWLADQEVRGPVFVRQTTKDWVWAQQMREADRLGTTIREKDNELGRKWWEETARMIDDQAKQWMAQAEASRQAALREAEKTRKMREDIRRIQARADARDAKRRRAREQVRIDAESRIKAWLGRENAAKKLTEAWNAYESRWATLQGSSAERLTFRTIPWPVVGSPSKPSSMNDDDIASFLLSSLHSENKSPKDRIREAMQRWHNDKFEPRLLPRVVEHDKIAVKSGVDIVVRCLNDLLARY